MDQHSIPEHDPLVGQVPRRLGFVVLCEMTTCTRQAAVATTVQVTEQSVARYLFCGHCADLMRREGRLVAEAPAPPEMVVVPIVKDAAR